MLAEDICGLCPVLMDLSLGTRNHQQLLSTILRTTLVHQLLEMFQLMC